VRARVRIETRLKRYNQEVRERLLTLLIASYIGAELVSNVTAGRLVALGPLVIPGALFLYALTFTLRDAIQVAGGLRVARDLTWGGLLANGLLACYSLLVLQLPAPQGFPTQPYQEVLHQGARTVIASLTAYGVSTYVDAWIFQRLGRRLIARILFSNGLGILIDTLLFITLAFAGTGAPLGALIVGQLVIKFLVSSLLIPLVYWVRQLLAQQGLRMEGL
jgi:uncharacterized integral membrane protein (TIGR00697 family)